MSKLEFSMSSVRLLVLAVLAVLLVGIPAANAQSSWSVVPIPTGCKSGMDTCFLRSVSMVSASEGWAVGDWASPTGPAVILHYAGGLWSAVTSPTTGFLFSVFMVSPSDGWAVGGTMSSGTILHYTGGLWSAVTSPTVNGLLSVFMINAGEGWAVGASGTILHYTGGLWSLYTASNPTTDGLASVFMVNAGEGWAVGGGTILHYIGGLWSAVTSPTIGPLTSVFMVSATEGWAVGLFATILHYTGGSWSAVTSPTTYHLESVFMLSASDGWIVGQDRAILHYDGGSWSIVTNPSMSDFFSVFMVSADEGWAVGDFGAIIHYAPVPFDFSLSNSGDITVTQGSSGSNTIYVTLVSGTTESVSLSCEGKASTLPSGASCSFNPASDNPDFNSQLTITTSPSTPIGSTIVTVTGTDGGLSRTTQFMLTVNAPPSPPAGAPVGGSMASVNKLAVLVPYLALFGIIAAVVVVVAKRWEKPQY
jgi:photosystem II stability/assembly factor-like uncharacterized protein